MAEDFVDVALLSIERRAAPGADLSDIVSFSVTTAQEQRPVYTMRKVRTARGFRSGARTITGEIEVAVPISGMPVDFEQMHADREEFNMGVVRSDGGVRKTLVDVRISEVQESSNAEGEHTLRVSFVAVDYRSDLPGAAVG
jgi:hypothetical protein